MTYDNKAIDHELLLAEIDELADDIDTFNPLRYQKPTVKIYALMRTANRLNAWCLFEKIVERKIDATELILDKEISVSPKPILTLMLAPPWDPKALELFLKSGISLRSDYDHNPLSCAIASQMQAIWPSTKKIELLLSAGASPDGLFINNMPLESVFYSYIAPLDGHALREVRLHFFKSVYKLLHKTRYKKQLVRNKLIRILSNTFYCGTTPIRALPVEIARHIAELTYQYRN